MAARLNFWSRPPAPRVLAPWGWWLALAVTLIATLAWTAGWLNSLDYLNNRIVDRFFVERPLRAPVVIVAIDDRSIETVGRWPWDRSVHAKLLNQLRPLRPAAIAFDISFFERSKGNGDKLLAQALSGLPVVLAAEAQDFSGLTFRRALKPIFGDDQNAGYVNLCLDRDGLVRSAWAHYQYQSSTGAASTVSPLALATLEKLCPQQQLSCEKNALTGQWHLRLPQHFRIAFAGPPGYFPHYSYVDVLAGRVPTEALRRRIILIGATAPDLHDAVLAPTSQGQAMSGVEVQANIIETIWSRLYLTEVGWAGHLILVLLLALAVATYFRRTHKIIFLVLATLLLIGAVTAAAALAFEFGYIFQLVFINFVVLLTFVVELGYVYVSEGRRRRFIENAFKPYVSEKILHIISEKPTALALGGEKRLVTVLFSDIRGFIGIAEKNEPELLGRVLNEYFRVMSEIILAEDGLIDKFVGDAIMAIWGAPLNDDKQAERACRAALKMTQRLNQLRDDFGAKGWPRIEIGIGINTGPAVVGNFGSPERFSYTAIGDTVNLAARFESANKEFDTSIIISEFTKKQLPDGQFRLRSLGPIKIRGKERAVVAFELLGLSEQL